MSKKVILVISLTVLVLLGLSACSPTCDPGSLEPPDLLSPDWREVVDGTSAVLDWSYPDASCDPEDFEIILSKDRDYSSIEFTQLVGGNTSTLTLPTLDIAEVYFWRVRAKVGSTYGPYSQELRSFFTLPYCGAADLVSPLLVSPDFGGIFDRGYDSLEWEWPLTTCIPESYRVEVSLGSPSFSDTTYNGGTGSPGTRWGFGSTPPGATQFWWRISAFADGAYSPPSLAGMFWTDPVCPAASLVAPVVEQPLEGDVVTIGNPIFAWSYPDSSCAPEGYHLQVSNTPDMSSIVLDANNPTLAARAMQSGIALDDCTEYYWQVAVISDGLEGPPSPVTRFVIDTAGTCGCAAGATSIPVQTDPGNYSILPDTNAHLGWYNPGGCIPDGAAVQIATDYDFGDLVEFTIPGEFITGYDPASLEPATQYRWKAAYYVEDAGSPLIGDYSGPRSFFTGPECSLLAEVVAPVRLAPADGSTVNTLTPALKYTTGIPGCIPDGYLLHLHEMADFSDPNLLTEYTLPATTVLTDLLTNCQTYHWSVTAVQDGGYGPESSQGSFTVDVDGTCLPGIPASAKSNNFCRIGTYPEHHEAVWTFETGDPALAVARNPFSTYLQLMVIDEKTNKPMEPLIICWSLFSAFKPGWGPTLAGIDDFKDLPVVVPPPTPTPTPPPYCHVNMAPDSCRAVGGTPNLEKKSCQCP